MTSLPSRPTVDVQVELRGELPREAAEHARRRMLGTIARLGPTAHSVRVKLTRVHGGEVGRTAMAQATVGLGERTLRAQVAAPGMQQAVRLLQDRLLDRAARLRPYWDGPFSRDSCAERPSEEGPYGEGPYGEDPCDEGLFGERLDTTDRLDTADRLETAELLDTADRLDTAELVAVAELYRPGRERAQRPEYARRPLGEREIARRKCVVPARLTPRQAVLAMAAMDFDFHLFSEAATGRDCVAYWQQQAGGYRILRAAGGSCAPALGDPHAAPRIGTREAARRLWLGGRPFVFFTSAEDGRGRLLYRRYDGHYGLIVPRPPAGSE
ncbi:sigma 54 modulation/S30EA ribosomal C-terminal domain-containing protein [Kitasatospora sp. HPMI-4]|uniref:sigma 54 modulation/S30EA ribosomal C-terminal domain-containing protein n=1 Tax=Kitasatospora sp. HPMI-4 TaxID=3448443 RepID=UPI003F1B8924